MTFRTYEFKSNIYRTFSLRKSNENKTIKNTLLRIKTEGKITFALFLDLRALLYGDNKTLFLFSQFFFVGLQFQSKIPSFLN